MEESNIKPAEGVGKMQPAATKEQMVTPPITNDKKKMMMAGVGIVVVLVLVGGVLLLLSNNANNSTPNDRDTTSDTSDATDSTEDADNRDTINEELDEFGLEVTEDTDTVAPTLDLTKYEGEVVFSDKGKGNYEGEMVKLDPGKYILVAFTAGSYIYGGDTYNTYQIDGEDLPDFLAPDGPDYVAGASRSDYKVVLETEDGASGEITKEFEVYKTDGEYFVKVISGSEWEVAIIK